MKHILKSSIPRSASLCLSGCKHPCQPMGGVGFFWQSLGSPYSLGTRGKNTNMDHNMSVRQQCRLLLQALSNLHYQQKARVPKCGSWGLLTKPLPSNEWRITCSGKATSAITWRTYQLLRFPGYTHPKSNNCKVTPTLMSELFLHIGAHKTGTTALQKFFQEQANTLHLLGVLYPATNWYHHSQHRLAFAMKKMRDPAAQDFPELEQEVDELNEAIANDGSPQIFISSEEFFSCPPERILQFSQLLVAESIQIVATVRRPDDMLLSMYNQKAKQPGNKFKRLIKPFLDAPQSLDPDLSFLTCITNWTSAFGTDRLTLLTYETDGPVNQMLRVLGLECGAVADAARLNKSVPGAVIEIMRLSKAMNLDRAIQDKLYKIARKELSDRPQFYLSDDMRRTVVAAFEEDNNTLFAQFGQENPYTLASYEPVETGEPRQNMSFRDLMVLINLLLENGN